MSGSKAMSDCAANFQNVMAHSHQGIALVMASEMDILDVLLKADSMLTSEEIADAKQLKERYVRELLYCLGCANIILMERHEGVVKYKMSEDMRQIFSDTLLPSLNMLNSSVTRMEPLKQCIRKSGPYDLSYTKTPVSLEAICSSSARRQPKEMELMVTQVPGLKQKLESGIKVIEIGSGKGLLISQLAKRFPNSSFTGSEYDDPSFATLETNVKPLGLDNLKVTQLDVMNVPGDLASQFDFCFVSDVIHDLPKPVVALKGIRNMLTSNSYFAVTEIKADSDVMANKGNQLLATFYSASAFHCVAQAYQSDDSEAHGACWGTKACCEALVESGFEVISEHCFEGYSVMYICKAV